MSKSKKTKKTSKSRKLSNPKRASDIVIRITDEKMSKKIFLYFLELLGAVDDKKVVAKELTRVEKLLKKKNMLSDTIAKDSK